MLSINNDYYKNAFKSFTYYLLLIYIYLILLFINDKNYIDLIIATVILFYFNFVYYILEKNKKYALKISFVSLLIPWLIILYYFITLLAKINNVESTNGISPKGSIMVIVVDIGFGIFLILPFTYLITIATYLLIKNKKK